MKQTNPRTAEDWEILKALTDVIPIDEFGSFLSVCRDEVVFRLRRRKERAKKLEADVKKLMDIIKINSNTGDKQMKITAYGSDTLHTIELKILFRPHNETKMVGFGVIEGTNDVVRITEGRRGDADVWVVESIVGEI